MSGSTATARTDVDATPEQVWSALTEPDQVAAWMAGSRVQTSWEVGSPITWSGDHDGKAYQDKGEVLVYDPPSELSVTHYSPLMGEADVPASYHTLVFTLSRVDGGTRLDLSQDGCADDGQAEMFSRSWQQMLDALAAQVRS